jgi:spermidine synthase
MNPRPFVVALVLAAGSGCAALAHELLWTRRLVDLLGAGSASSTRVFGCFFLGLSLGAAWSARRVPTLRRPFRAVAIAEAGVALLAVPIWMLPAWTGWIWPALGPDKLAGWQGDAVKLFISGATITTPAFLMGTVLPFLGAAVLREGRGLGRHGIWLYAVNTLGGVLGLAVVIGFALDALGASGAMAGAIALNCLVAAGALLLDRASAERSGPTPVEEPAPGDAAQARQHHGTRAARDREQRAGARRRGVARATLIVSFASGLGVLALEVLALEMVTLRAPLSFHATSAVLITVILLLAVASLAVPALTPDLVSPRAVLLGALALTAMAAALTPAVFSRVALDPAWETPAASVPRFALSLTGLALFTLGPVIFLAGLVFPATLAWLGDEGDDPQGQRWGVLLAVNGIGAVIGAEGTYRILMPMLGVYPSVGVIAVAYALFAAWLLFESGRIGAGRVGATARRLPLVAIGVVVAVLAMFQGYGVASRAKPGLLYERTGRGGTVVVLEDPRFGRAIVVNNRYMLGTSMGRWDEERQTHIALALHPAPRDVAHIGSGTGITPGAALDYPEIESVTALELSPVVRDAAARFFSEYNHDIANAERASVIVQDGRTFVASTVNSFDVVTGDAFLPWGPGVGRLYSLEHFQAVRAALRPGGVFCQWLPMHQLTRDQLEMIADTFARVFADVHVFRNTFYLRSPGLALVGLRDAELDWDVARDRASTARASGILDPVARHSEALAMLYLGRYHPNDSPNAEINTLNNLAVELSAARERVTGDIPAKYLIGPAWMGYLRARVMRPDNLEAAPPQIRELARLGVTASEYEGIRDRSSVQARELRSALREQLPSDLRDDRNADWKRWPGDAALVR